MSGEYDERAARAVLQTLAERISAGEARDLIEWLPPELAPYLHTVIAVLPVELHTPLRRGRQEGGKTAQRMSLEEFVTRVAEREGVSPAEAREHVRAVFATLREAIPSKEFVDVTAQLPHEYDPVAAHP